MIATVSGRDAQIQEIVNSTLQSWGIRRAIILGEGSSLTNDAEMALVRALQQAIPGVKLPARLQVEGTARTGFRIANLPQ